MNTLSPPGSAVSPRATILTLAVSLCLVSLPALLFGRWFLANQLALVAPDLPGLFPPLWAASFLAQAVLWVLVAYLAWLVLLTALCTAQLSIPLPAAYVRASALAFWPLGLVAAGLPQGTCGLAVLAGLGAVGLAALTRVSPERRRELAALAGVVLVLTLYQLIWNRTFSPLFWDRVLTAGHGATPGYLFEISPGFRALIWSKFFSFSNMDLTYWAATPNVSNDAFSLVLPVLSFFLDIPSLDLEALRRLLLGTVFVLSVAGSLGMFLFLRRGLGLNPWLALLGGLLMVLGNAYYNRTLTNDGAFFSSNFLLLPVALHLFSRAMTRGSLPAALGSGLALGLPLLLLAPHPESMILSSGCFLILASFFLLQPGLVDPRRKLLLLLACGATALACSAIYILPIAEALARQNLIVFGHSPLLEGHAPFLRWPEKLVYILIVLVPVIWAGRRLKPALRPWIWTGATIYGLVTCFHALHTDWQFHLSRLIHLPLNINADRRLDIYRLLFSQIMFLILANALWTWLQAENATTDASPGQASDEGRAAALVRAARRVRERWQAARAAWPRATGLVLPLACLLIPVWQAQANFLSSGREIANPQACDYEITLSTHLANYPGLARDKANESFLLRKLLAFEHSPAGQEATRPAARKFRESLAARGLASAAELTAASLLPFAREVAEALDEEAFGPESCIYPHVQGINLSRDKGVHRYNNAGLYARLPRPGLRILAATGDEITKLTAPRRVGSDLGVGHGLFIINSSTTLDTRFMMGSPLLHALYLLPGGFFEDRGRYTSPKGWELDPLAVLAPEARRLYDLAGVDVFTIPQENLAAVDPSLTPLPGHIPAAIDPHYVPLLNAHSRGAAYFSTQARFQDPEESSRAEAVIRGYFRKTVDLTTYKDLVEGLRARLLTLDPGEILVENPGSGIPTAQGKGQDQEKTQEQSQRQAPGQVQGQPQGQQGQVVVSGIVGARAAFKVISPAEGYLVYNLASTPGWKAFVDARPVPALRANLAFLAAKVPAGEHTVWFEYRPGSEVVGSWLTLGALMIGLLVLLRAKPL